MKKIININLSGRIIPIEDTAYEMLKGYLESLLHYFSREEGGDEIVSDIENRIAELFQEKLKKDTHCITDDDVSRMIATMGRPEQLEEEISTEPLEKESAKTASNQPKAHSQLSRNQNDQLIGGVCSGMANYFKIDPAIVRIITFILIGAYGIGLLLYIVLWIVLPGKKENSQTLRKRLYRDPDHKVIGGVAAGLGAYFKIDIVIPRIIFVLPLLGVIFTSIFANGFNVWGFHHIFFPFSVGALPTLVVLYIVLWIAVPRAVTQAEKLEMRGEKVDLQSISHAYKATDSEKNKLNKELPASTSNAQNSVKKHGGLGELFGTLVKIVLYIILAVIIVALCGLLIGASGGFFGVTAMTSFLFPLKSLFLSGTLQHILFWPAVILTFGIPVVALIWILISVFTGIRMRFRYLGLSLFMLWIIGVVSAVSLGVSVAKDFKMRYSHSNEIAITQPQNTLILKKTLSNETITGWDDDGENWVMEDFVRLNKDSIKLKTVRVSVRKSEDSNYSVRVVRYSNGRTADQARYYASLIDYPIVQKDAVLYIPDGFILPKDVPFRNQHLVLQIFVPAGGNIDFRDGLDDLKDPYFDEEDWEVNDEQKVFHMSVEGGLMPDIKIEVKDQH